MTVPFPLDAFENAQTVRPRRPAPDRSKLISLAITLAIHAAILGALLTAAEVEPPQIMRELSVQITPDKSDPTPDIMPLPKLARPVPVAVVMPQIQSPLPDIRPVTASPPPAQAPAAPASAPAAPPESRDSYLARLLAQLNHFKQYPSAARAGHIEGVVMLHFVMDAQGRVLSFEIAKSSGHPVLDDEVLALIQRAQPLPPLPANFPTRTLDAIVPVQFAIH